MKDLEFKEYVKEYQDEDGDTHTSVVRAAVIDESTARITNDQGNKVPREVNTFTGARKVSVGDAFVELPGKPGVYDHLTAEGWASSEYVPADEYTAQGPADDESEPVDADEDESSNDGNS